MSVTVLSGADLQLPPRAAALARFAVHLTARPWALTADLVTDLAANGFDENQAEAAAAVVSMFNYLTRVADASGIEFDYDSPLPEFEPDRTQEATARPDRPFWPVVARRVARPAVAGPASTSAQFEAFDAAWRRWRDYVFEADKPLTRRERLLLAGAAAEECCDRWRADELQQHRPDGEAEAGLVAFARKLSREPWRMQPADLDALRLEGFAEPALLHAIAVVALQNAESRLAFARAAINSR